MSTLTNPGLSQPAQPTTLITAAEFEQKYGGASVELVKGIVKELPMPQLKHGRSCVLAARWLDEFAEKADLGRVMSNDSFVQTGSNPDTVRGADICYYSFQRLPKGPIPEGLISVAPDLVIEVRSPSELWTELFAKVGEYLKAGVRVVIVLDAKSASASVYRPDELQQIFHNGDLLVVPDVLPGFSVPVQRLFE